jgi:hypothetical protein
MSATTQPTKPTKPRRYWSKQVTEHSDALDLKDRTFKRSPKEIARALKRAAEHSARRKSSPFQSAMSMLTFYANRAGRHLSARQQRALVRAKDELRRLFGREPARKSAAQ